MIGFSIHVPSLLIGFFIGYVAIATVFLSFYFSEKWHNGFSLGWEAGRQYEQDRMTVDKAIMLCKEVDNEG